MDTYGTVQHICIGGTPAIYLQEVDSTNNYAKRLIADGKIGNGCLVVAQRQTAGRGRSGKSFYSFIDGAIYMSIVYKASKISDPASITIAAAVAVATTLEQHLNIHPSIKWVNDLFWDNRKFCGILSEATGGYIIVGIGINCNASPQDFPCKLREIAGSIPLNGVNASTIIASIYDNLYKYINTEFSQVINEYRKRSLMLGKKINYCKDSINISAVAVGIDDNGRLIVKTDNGDTDQLSSGEVIIVEGLYSRS